MFVGRDREVSALRQWCEGEGVALMVCGVPGVGKSTLCEHVLGQLDSVQKVWLDVQRWVGGEKDAMMHALAGALGVSWGGDEELLWAYMSGSRHVIVLDNTESIEQVALLELVCDPAWRARGVKWLCTTRVLDVPDEVERLYLGPLSGEGARDAALEIVQIQLSAGHGCELDEDTLDTLFQSLEYHPLSLVWCGRMMRWLGQEPVANRLIESAHGGVDQDVWPHARLDEVFASLWNMLDEPTQALLGRLAVMPQPVERADVWSLCAPLLDVEHASEQACRYGGLIDEGQQLRMTQAWRTYCASRFISQAQDHRTWLDALVSHYVEKHDGVWARWSRLDELAPLHRVRRDRETLRWLFMARDEVSSPDWPRRFELGLIMCVAYQTEERLLEVQELLFDAVGDVLDVEAIGPKLFIQIELLCHELVATYDEHTMRRLEYVWEALLSNPAHDALELSYMIATNLVFARILRTEMDDAQRIVACVRAQEHEWEARGFWVPEVIRARFEMRVATLVHQQRQLDEALPLYQEALVLARSSQDRRTQAMLGHNLGVLYTDLCELDEAYELLSLAKPVEAFLGRALRAMNLLSRGMVWLRRGGCGVQAREAFRASADIMARTQLRGSLGAVDYNLGVVALDESNNHEARHYLEQGKRTAHMHQDIMLELSLRMLECNVLLFEGMPEESLEMARTCAERCVEYGDAMKAVRACFRAIECLVLVCTQRIEEASHLVTTWMPQVTHEPYLESMWAHLEAEVWLGRSRQGKARARQAAWLEWLARARMLSQRNARRPSESARFILTISQRTLSSRESNYWELFFRRQPEAWAGKWVIDQRSGVVLSSTGQWLDLSRHELLLSLLSTFVAHQGDVISSDTLQGELWPDEVILSEAANNRMHVALSKLRALGLASCLERKGEGYVLDPDVEFVVMT